jgi:WD40 repeat protein
MPRKRPTWSAELRRRVFERARAGEDPAVLARELGPTVRTIRKWAKEAEAQAQAAAPLPAADLPPRAIAALEVLRLKPAFDANELAFSPDGRELHVFGKGGTVSCFDGATGVAVRRPRASLAPSAAPWTSPDGRLVVSMGPRFEVKRASTGKAIWSDGDWHPGGGSAVAFPCAGRLVAFARDREPAFQPIDPSLRLIDARTGRLVRELAGLSAPVVWLPGCGLLAAVQAGEPCAVAFIEPESGRIVRALPAGMRIGCIAFSPDERRLAVTGDPGLMLLDAETGAELVEPSCGIFGLAISPDGRWLAALRTDGRVRLWDRTSRDRPCRTEPANEIAFAPAGADVAVARGEKIERRDPATWAEVAAAVARPPELAAIAWLDGRTLALASHAGLRIVKLGTGREVRRIEHPEVEREVQGYAGMFDCVTERYREPAHIFDAAAAPGGRIVATAGEDAARLWDATARKELAMLAPEPRAIAMSPDGRSVAVASARGLELFDAGPAPLGALLGEGRLRLAISPVAAISGIAFSPDGSRIAAFGDRTIRLHDAATGASAGSLTGHEAEVTAVVWAPDGRSLFSADGFGVLLEWDARS